MSIPEEILERLRKLLSLEEGARSIGSLHEAEVAATKAQEILLKYNLDRSKVDKEEAPFIISRFRSNDLRKHNEGEWLIKLYSGICTYNMCEFIIFKGRNLKHLEEFAIIGTKENIEIVNYLAAQLTGRLRILAKQSWSRYSGPEKHNSFIRGFLAGGALGIRDKLRTEWQAQQNKNEQIYALVKHNSAALTNYMEQQFPTLKEKKSRAVGAQDGIYEGYQAGRNLDIRKGLDQKNNLNQNLLDKRV